MSRKITDEEIGKEIKKAIDRLEYSTELLKMWVEYMDSDLSEAEEILVSKSHVDYCDINEEELTESQRIYLRRCKEFLGVK